MGVSSPSLVTPSRSFQSFTRPLSSQDPVIRSPSTPKLPMPSPDTTRATDTSQSSSSSSCGSPAVPTSHYQRPSTLHGLKHKLHSAAKSIHSPNRRKSVGHIPLSPLARTPSPSPLPSSPTRSPSPLAFPPGHQPGSSNTTQSYSPGTQGASSGKKSFSRPKSTEPGSPLLRRAFSPDRLHPRSAESKAKPCPTTISPLCDPALKVTISSAPRVTITSKSPPVQKVNFDNEHIKSKPPEHPLRKEKDRRSDSDILSHEDTDSEFVSITSTSQPLPRIAEEKDSPTAIKDELPQNINPPADSDSSLQTSASALSSKSKAKSSIKSICAVRKTKKDVKEAPVRL
ncbi:hypothetical protein AAG570_012669 [Ranatra chinensis]|uniref:Uncharacterized protein n=1 Tax=Ranatra chinensis TaxID=642074 RepID=A0ABD0YEI6_9HEMI